MSIFNSSSDIKMFDEQSFYRAFEKDLHLARRSVIIESPFITLRRIDELLPVFTKLRRKGVAVTINTRNPIEHDAEYETQARIEMIAVLVVDQIMADIDNGGALLEELKEEGDKNHVQSTE